MNWGLTIAVVTFLSTVVTIMVYWRLYEARHTIRNRLGQRVRGAETGSGIFRTDHRDPDPKWRWLTTLIEQAGYEDKTASRVLLMMGAFALVGGAAGAYRSTGGIFAGVLLALIAGSLPYFYLLRKRHQRFQQFEQQFPDALDMITRSIRAGHALSGAIQLVGEEMPDPVGQEFRRVFEEIRLGLDAGEALLGIQRRVPTEDTSFFYTTVDIQRIGGGNLAEILDRMAEVIRERFKLLKHARVLSTQHRWTAICVGLSPVVFALFFELTNPGYFDPLLKSPHAPYMLLAGFALEAIGFFSIWRIAQIEV